ncbi:ClpP/crotonase [Sarocladium strictum]
MAEPALVEVSTPAEGVRLIAFNRPQKRNALSKQLIKEFLAELDNASTDEAIRAVIITGNGPLFSAGADIKEIAVMDAEAARSCRYLEDLCHGMQAMRKPLLAAVNGHALGGGFEVALMCDLIFASKSTQFSLPEATLGLIPGAGGTQRLTSSLGKFRAMRTILLGKPIGSEEALAAGLVCDVFEDDKVLDGAVEAAVTMVQRPPKAMQMAKEAILRADDLGRDDLFERNLYYSAFGSSEMRSGTGRFLNKKV